MAEAPSRPARSISYLVRVRVGVRGRVQVRVSGRVKVRVRRRVMVRARARIRVVHSIPARLLEVTPRTRELDGVRLVHLHAQGGDIREI